MYEERTVMKLLNAEKSISQIVTENTGMTVDQLINDKREWTYDFTELFELIGKKKPKRIIIFGDYDDDGVWGTWILKGIMRETTDAEVFTRLPHRLSEGYGAKPSQLEPFGLTDSDMVITIDNGVAAFDAINYAKECGATVIIMDHHQPAIDSDGNVTLPDADLIFDAHFDGKSNFTDWCAGGMAAMLALQAPVSEIFKKQAIVAGAIATVGDSVTLVDGNRWLLKEGLRLINTDRDSRCMGLYSLMVAMKCEEYVDEQTIGFSIVPCINAAGRLLDDGAEQALALADADTSFSEAYAIAENLVAINEERKSLTDFWAGKCFEFVESKGYDKDKAIVIANDGIHEGIVGIIAGKLMEKYNRPSFVFTKHSTDDLLRKGSGRSAQGVNLKDLLDRHQELLYAYGGHSGAAGLTVSIDNYGELRIALNEDLKDTPYEEETITADITVEEKDLERVADEIDRFAPYGVGNPAPVLYIPNFKLYPIKGKDIYLPIGKACVKFQGLNIQAVSFRGLKEYEELGFPEEIGLVGTLGKNYFNGVLTTQFLVQNILPPAKPESKIIHKTALQLMLERSRQKGAS